MRRALRRLALAAVAGAAALFGPEAAYAAPWCGAAAAADRPAISTGYPVRVLYLFAADGADRTAELAPAIWADVEEIDAWWRANDPTRTVNFDLTAFPCGPQLDLTARRVAPTAAALTPGNTRFGLIRDEVYQRAGFDAVFSKYLVYYDGPVEDPTVCGEGASAGPSGTGLAIVYLQACPEISRPYVSAHELVHAIGALFRITAPNACPGDPGHVCDSPGDILFPQAQPLPLSSLVLDAGRDDYYGHGHPWFDVQDSRWLRHLDQSSPVSLVVRGRGSVRSDVPGLACAVTCRTGWNPGTAIILRAQPAAGQRFVGWNGACVSTADRCDLLVDGPVQVTALFAPRRYRLAVQVAGQGHVAGGGLTCRSARCARDVESHRSVTLRATPARGWRLKAWTGACRGARAACVVPMRSATSVRATFVRRATT